MARLSTPTNGLHPADGNGSATHGSAANGKARSAASTSAAAKPFPVLVPRDLLAGKPDVPLNRPITVVGTGETCRLTLDSRTVSRHHAVFLVDAGRTYVADLASRTGVLVNNKATHQTELLNGDRVQIGKFVFRYRGPAADAPVPPGEPAPAAAAVVAGLLAVPLAGRVALVGRRETSDVALVGDPGVSAAHAALFHVGGQWYVRDLGSRTGTLVNGTAVVQQPITFGDRITVGAATIQFEPAAAVPGPASLPAPTMAPPAVEPAPLPLLADEVPVDLSDEPSADSFDPLPPSADERPDAHGMVATAADPGEPAVTATEAVSFDFVDELSVPDVADLSEPVAVPTDSDASSARVADPIAAEPVDEVPMPDATGPFELLAGLPESATDEPVAPSSDVDTLSLPAEPDAHAAMFSSAEPVEVDVTATAALEPVPLADPAAGVPPTAEAMFGSTGDELTADVAEQLPTTPDQPDVAAASDTSVATDDLPDIQFGRDVESAPASGLPEAVVAAASPTADPPTDVELADFVFVPTEGAATDTPDELYWGDTDPDVGVPPAVPTAPPADEPTEAEAVAAVPPHPPADADGAVDAEPEPIDFAAPPVDGETAELSFPIEPPVAPADPLGPTAVAEPFAPEGLDPSLAVTPVDHASADPAATEAPVAPIAFDDLLDAPPAEVAAEPSPAVAAAPLSDADLDYLDVLDAPLPAEPPSADPFGAVVNVADVTADAVAVTATEALAPVDDFTPADVGGAAVEAFEAVSDPTLATAPVAPPPEPPAAAVADEDDLAFLDFGDPEPAPVAEVAVIATPAAPPTLVETVIEPPAVVTPDAHGAVELPGEPAPPTTAVVPPAVAAPAVTPSTPAMTGPSLFGFSFEGGSFLGGMPLPLTGPAAPLPPGGLTFEQPAAQRQVPPPVEPSARVRPAAPPQSAAVAEPLGLTGMVHGKATAPVPPPPPAVAPVGLAPPVTAARSAAAVPPPPVPPAAVTAPLPPARPRTADVFSQMAGPIGVEAFATRPKSPDQYHIPEVDRSAPAARPGPFAAPAAESAPPADQPGHRYATPGPSDDAYLIAALLRHKYKVRKLIAATVLLPLLWIGGTFAYVSRQVVVEGRLTFSGLAENANKSQFFGQQAQLLCGEDVRVMAAASLRAQNQPQGLTADANAMDLAIRTQQTVRPIQPADGGNTLLFTLEAADAASGQAQVKALLTALRTKDEPLTDARAKAKVDLDKAEADDEKARQAYESLKAQQAEQRRLSDAGPDHAKVVGLDDAAADAVKQSDKAKADQAELKARVDALRQLDPSKPPDPDADPVVMQLQGQLKQFRDNIAQAEQMASRNGIAPKAADDDPAMAMLRGQADALSAQIERRKDEVRHSSAVPKEQRAHDRDVALAAATAKLGEADTAAAAAVAAVTTTAAAAKDVHDQEAAARLAGYKLNDLIASTGGIEADLKQADRDLADHKAALAASVVVAGTPEVNPSVKVTVDTDPRWAVAGIGGGLLLVVFGGWLLSVAGTSLGDDDQAEVPPADADPA